MAFSARNKAYLARVVQMSGFGGRRSGEYLIAKGETSEGFLLSDEVSQEIVQKAALMTSGTSRLLSFSLGDDEAVRAGLACGGSVKVLLQDTVLLPREMPRLLASRIPFVLASSLSEDCADATVVVGESQGNQVRVLGTPLAESILSKSMDLLNRGKRTSIIWEGEPAYHIEVFVPTTKIVIIGKADLAVAIQSQATQLGWESFIEDDPSAALKATFSLGPLDALVVLSHDHELATPLLATVMQSSPRTYVGCLGSRHTQEERRERLRSLEVEETSIAEIYGPVGLDLGSRTPQEVALAICAEILGHIAGRELKHLRDTTGTING